MKTDERQHPTKKSISVWFGSKIFNGFCLLIVLIVLFFHPLLDLAWHYVEQRWQRSADLERLKEKHLEQMHREEVQEAASLGISVEELRIKQIEELIKNNPNDEFAKSVLRTMKKRVAEQKP